MTIALYPGGFDPVTNGHLDIIHRAAALFDELVVAVYAREKSELFSQEERVDLVRGATSEMTNVRVEAFEGLVVAYAREVGATVMVRGIRAVTDFEAEFDMALMNKKMAPEVESVYLMTSHEYLFISASRIREIASLGHPVADLVPANVAAALTARFGSVDAGSR